MWKSDKLKRNLLEVLILGNEGMLKHYNKDVVNVSPKLKVVDKVIVNGIMIKSIRHSKELDKKRRGPFKVKSLTEPYTNKSDKLDIVGHPYPVYHLYLLKLYYRNQIDGRKSPAPSPLLDLGLNYIRNQNLGPEC